MTDPRALAAELVNAVLLDGHSLSERLAALRAGTDPSSLSDFPRGCAGGDFGPGQGAVKCRLVIPNKRAATPPWAKSAPGPSGWASGRRPLRCDACPWNDHGPRDAPCIHPPGRPTHPTGKVRQAASALAAAQSLAYGTLRAAGRLRFFLRRLAERPLNPPDLAGFLLVGLHELDAELSPAYAAVNETVATAARRFPRARGFVNAVLRNFQRRREELAREALTDDEARWNFPLWWLNRLRAEYPQAWRDIVDAQNRHPPMTLRVNRRQITLGAYRDELARAGIEHRCTGDMAVTLTRPLPVAELPGFADGLVSVQDFGAQWAAPLLAVADGMRVLDACAAPGGKTGHLLELAELDLLALDGDALRLRRVRDNLERLHLRAELLAADAGDPAHWWDGRAFDRILLDAPCTASGVARRHPDGKWLKRAEDMQHLAREQSRLLGALWPLLRPGGRMLYATCSLFRAENAAQVADFLSRHPDAALEPIAPDGAREGQILPDPDMDGFFYARLLKT